MAGGGGLRLSQVAANLTVLRCNSGACFRDGTVAGFFMGDGEGRGGEASFSGVLGGEALSVGCGSGSGLQGEEADWRRRPAMHPVLSAGPSSGRRRGHTLRVLHGLHRFTRQCPESRSRETFFHLYFIALVC